MLLNVQRWRKEDFDDEVSYNLKSFNGATVQSGAVALKKMFNIQCSILNVQVRYVGSIT